MVAAAATSWQGMFNMGSREAAMSGDRRRHKRGPGGAENGGADNGSRGNLSGTDNE